MTLAGRSPKDGVVNFRTEGVHKQRTRGNGVPGNWNVLAGWFKDILGAGQIMLVLLCKKGKKKLSDVWLLIFSPLASIVRHA